MTSTRRVTRSGWGRGTTTERWSVDGQDPGHVEHVVRLQAEVQLLDHGLGEQLDQGRRVGQGGDGDAADEGGGDPAHGREIPADQLVDRRSLHLDHDLLAAAQRGRVDLGDGRGGEGLGGEGGEDSLERLSQIGFHDRLDGLERLRGDAVTQQPELATRARRETGPRPTTGSVRA